MNRIALYARVSSEIQEKEATIESQVALLREAAAKQGDLIVGEYRDDGFSGDLLARPALDRLRDDAAQKLFDRVLILSPDRLARKYIYGEVIADELRKHDVVIQFLNQKDDGSAESKLLLGITGLFGQYEKAKMIERIRRGRLHCAKSGRVMTATPPFGYDYIPKSPKAHGHLRINDQAAKTIRLIFDLYVKGLGVSAIALELQKAGIPSPTGRPVWARSSIMKYLRSETYAGVWHYNKKISAAPYKIRKPNAVRRRVNTTQHVRPRDQWVEVPGVPAIIDRGLFEAAQRQLMRNRRFSPRRTHRPYLLAGLIQCGVCQRAVYGSPNNGYTYYRCSRNFSFAGMPAACDNKARNSLRMDGAIWDTLRQALQNPETITLGLPILQNGLDKDLAVTGTLRQDAERQLEQIRSAETRLLEAYSAGAMTLDHLQEQMGKLRAKRKALAMDLERAEDAPKTSPIDLADLAQLCRDVSRGLDVVESDFTQRQRFFRSVVDRVVMDRAGSRLIGGLVLPEGIREPFRSLDVVPLQQRGRRHIIQFELAVAV